MYNYGRVISPGRTSQYDPLFGREAEMHKNAAGGFVFTLDQWQMLDRFLILGTEGGTYYVGADKLTKDNARNVIACWNLDPERTAGMIARVSREGLAPKNDPAIFALAIGATGKSEAVRSAAYGIFRDVLRIPTHLFQFCEFANAQVPLGSKRFRRAVAQWYNERDIKQLVNHVVKYQQRNGWSHKDVLRLAHVKPSEDRKTVFDWIFDKGGDALPNLIRGFEEAKAEKDNPRKLAQLIIGYGLTREMIPTEGLRHPEVWDALLQGMPYTALIRNLGNMSKVELLKPLSPAERFVVEQLGNTEAIKAARVHPMALYLASMVYQQGKGEKGSGTWVPSQPVVAALEDAFYKAYGNVTPTGKRILVGIDSSGSMGGGGWAYAQTGYNAPISQAAAIAMVFLNTEPNVHCISVDTQVHQNGMTKRDSLAVAARKAAQGGGGTDMSLPYGYARAKGLDVDAFITITDNETWAGRKHPQVEFEQYAKKRNLKNIVIALTATRGSIGDTKDSRVLQIAGLDASVPQVVNQFLTT